MAEKTDKGNKQKRGGQISEGELQQSAIKAGLNSFVSSNPNLRNYAILISNNLDGDKIGNFIKTAKEKYTSENKSYEEQNKLIYNGLANYVASGNALKDTVIKTLLKDSQEGKLDRSVLEKIVGFFKPNKFEGTKYFEKARNAYSDMHDILAQDKMAQEKMPELVKAAEAMKMYGFLDVALKNFKTHGMMDDKTYKNLYNELYKNTAIQAEKGMKGLENYILSKKEKEEKEDKAVKKIAASIVGFAGIMLMLSNLTMTGAVIGGDSTITAGIVGLFMFFLALLLFFRPLKRSFKK